MRNLTPVGLAALALVAGCGGATGGASGDDGGDVATVTVPAEGVEVSVSVTLMRDDLTAVMTVTNETDADLMVTDPAGARWDGKAQFVALLPEVEPGYSDALSSPAAPPAYPAFLVEGGASIDIRESFGQFSPMLPMVEVCLEVAGAERNTAQLENGARASVSYREQGTPAWVACSGPVEIAEESFDDPVGEE